MKVYIAGPMTGYPDYNFPAFYMAEAWLQEAGFETVNPARLDAITQEEINGDGGLGNGSQLPAYLRRDFRELIECDGIVLMDGWRESAGANAELAVARWLDLRVWKLSLRDESWLEMEASAAVPVRQMIYDTWMRFGYETFKEQRREEWYMAQEAKDEARA